MSCQQQQLQLKKALGRVSQALHFQAPWKGEAGPALRPPEGPLRPRPRQPPCWDEPGGPPAPRSQPLLLVIQTNPHPFFARPGLSKSQNKRLLQTSQLDPGQMHNV